MGLRCECNGFATTSMQPIDVVINGVERTGKISVDVNICPSCTIIGSFLNFSYTDDGEPENNFSFTSQFVAIPICHDGLESDELRTTASGTTDGVNFNGETTLSSFRLLADALGDITISEISLIDEDGDTFVQDTALFVDGNVITCY